MDVKPVLKDFEGIKNKHCVSVKAPTAQLTKKSREVCQTTAVDSAAETVYGRAQLPRSILVYFVVCAQRSD